MRQRKKHEQSDSPHFRLVYPAIYLSANAVTSLGRGYYRPNNPKASCESLRELVTNVSPAFISFILAVSGQAQRIYLSEKLYASCIHNISSKHVSLR